MFDDRFTSRILMVRPAGFGFNPETAETNRYQSVDQAVTAEWVAAQAIFEFDRMVDVLKDAGVHVDLLPDRTIPATPDAVFPNNWFTTHADGTLITYPMYAPTRRLERSDEAIEAITSKYRVSKHKHLESYEEAGLFLEGTGSLVLDRSTKIAYAALGPRTSADLVMRFCKFTGYSPTMFHAIDEDEIPIYHTNVLMSIGHGFALFCDECLYDEGALNLVLSSLSSSGLEPISLTLDQVSNFAGNGLQLMNTAGNPVFVMSTAAFNALAEDQVEQIQQYTQIVHTDLSTIELHGGGSARCMIAENFLVAKTLSDFSAPNMR